MLTESNRVKDQMRKYQIPLNRTSDYNWTSNKGVEATRIQTQNRTLYERTFINSIE